MKSDQTGLGCKARDSLDRSTGAGLGKAKQLFFSVMEDMNWKATFWNCVFPGDKKLVWLPLDK